MMGMFFGFGGWFLYDGMLGYKMSNTRFHLHENFVEAGETFKEKFKAGITADDWKKYAASRILTYPEKSIELLSYSVKADEPWPDELADYELMKSGVDNKVPGFKAWEKYTHRLGMDAEPPKKVHDASSMRTQKILSAVTSALGLTALFFLLRTLGRTMEVDADGFAPAGGKKIPFSAMKQIDKRAWETKGLAHIFYEEGNEKKKARVDGLTYGGFKEESGAPAEALFQRILANFKGEIIEYVAVDDDDEPEDKGSEAK